MVTNPQTVGSAGSGKTKIGLKLKMVQKLKLRGIPSISYVLVRQSDLSLLKRVIKRVVQI